MKTIVIIPARYGSSRFPGKPLALLGGIPVIVRVCRNVAQTGFGLAVATDDERIARTVTGAGFQAVMTSPSHRSGTDRICEAYSKLGIKADVVVNVQGDEPFITPAPLMALAQCFADPDTDIATLYRAYPSYGSYRGLEDPNLVKLTLDGNGRALTFSRSVIPFLRGVERESWPASFPYITHVGVYAYRPDVLRAVSALPPSPLEKAESLEQLRWLQAGYRIRAVQTDDPTIGIDTPEDLSEAERFLSSRG